MLPEKYFVFIESEDFTAGSSVLIQCFTSKLKSREFLRRDMVLLHCHLVIFSINICKKGTWYQLRKNYNLLYFIHDSCRKTVNINFSNGFCVVMPLNVSRVFSRDSRQRTPTLTLGSYKLRCQKIADDFV